MNNLMEKIAEEAFIDELEKISKNLVMSTYDPGNVNVLKMKQQYGAGWKQKAWESSGGVGKHNMVSKIPAAPKPVSMV